MSKWIDNDKFKEFLKNRREDNESNVQSGGHLEKCWKTPQRGTKDDPKTYKLRFLPDPNGHFYTKYYYHMFKKTDGGWRFVFCPKTDDMGEFCPFCKIVSLLYQSGSDKDKEVAADMRRKERFVGNVYIIDDPRDAKIENDEDKATGKVKLYQFPGQIERKIIDEITDPDEGAGALVFDPSENGFTFILKVGETLPSEDGKTFPDYTASKFSRRASAIADNDKIEEIMDSVISIDWFFDSMRKSPEKMVNILKEEHLIDYVESDLIKLGWLKAEKTTQSTDESKNDSSALQDNVDNSSVVDDSSEDLSEEELLKELEQLTN